MLWNKKTKWCCPGFKGRYEAAGNQGFGALVCRDSEGHPRFILQHRAIEEGETLPSTGSVSVALVTETGMGYCPWCGRNLDRFYRGSIDQLNRPGLRVEDPVQGPIAGSMT